MSDKAPLKPLKERIVIRETSPGGNDLYDCYFLPSEVEGFFNFYDREGRTLATGVSSDSPFPFLLDRIAWTIHMEKIDKSAARGGWQNNAPGVTGGQDGTFQAESGGGADEDEVDSSCMPLNAIEIKHVHGGPDKEKLKHCYFVPTDAGEYDFHSKHCKLLQSGLTTDNDFSFRHDSIDWNVTEFKIDDVHAHGHWWNSDGTQKAKDGTEIAQDGTFQAESGGGHDEGEAYSAASA